MLALDKTMNPAQIRARLQARHDPHALNGDHIVTGWPATGLPATGFPATELATSQTTRPAAVLLPLVAHKTGLTVLLTQRTDHLAHHAGQVSFPGGRAEAHDNGPVGTALREAHEEIGLLPEIVEILGQLERYQTVTGFMVTPVVGLMQPPLELHPDPFEVQQIFEVPLDFILQASNHQRHCRVFQGQRRYYYALPYGEHYIWGATAAMLVSFARTISADG